MAALFFASGAAALLYEVLWLRQLGLLFGNTAQAAATSLAVFFLGMAVGARFWGHRAARTGRPLRAYALLELAVAASALPSLRLLDLYHAIYRPLAASLAGDPTLLSMVKLLLAAAVLFPPAFCIGGTLPLVSRQMVRRSGDLGTTFGWLYASNTAGGACGAFIAAFVSIPALGIARSYASAIAINLGLAGLAWMLDRRIGAPPAVAPRVEHSERGTTAAPLAALAFLSGAATLALEVLWTRMFAQVLHNSVYSFAAILVTFLVALALGAAVASFLCRRATAPAPTLAWLLAAAGLAVAVSPFLFHLATGGLRYVAPMAGWRAYVGWVFFVAGSVLLVPGICAGVVFPYLLRSAEPGAGPGAVVGRLVAWNTIGSIVGSLAAGFVLVDALGLWASIGTIAIAYPASALLCIGDRTSRVRSAIALMLLVPIALLGARLPIVLLAKGEQLREKWETGRAVIAVTQSGEHLRLREDNYYSLGGTAARPYEETQADVPLLIHPRPRRVLFIGLGTGITAGASLRHDVEAVTACEINPAVAIAAERYFAPFANGLFRDPRVRIPIEDGRQHLATTPERYDVIVSDLFIPWQAGAGSLYTREHYALARERLLAGGAFAQWLPFYQLTRRDALIVMRTMLEVFAQVTFWRGDFTPDQSIGALIGQEDGARLDPQAIAENYRRRSGASQPSRGVAVAYTGLFYAGNLSANRDLFAASAVNTDDRPLIEYLAPIAQRDHFGAGEPWFTAAPLAAFQDEIAKRVPPDLDPYLARLEPRERDAARAGLDLFHAALQRRAGNQIEARRHAEAFARHVPPEVYEAFRKSADASAGTGHTSP